MRSNVVLFIAFISFPLSVFSGLVLAPLFIILAVTAILSKPILKISLSQKVLAALIVWALITSFWSVNPDAFELWIKVALLTIGGFISIRAFTEIDKEKFSKVILVGFCFALLLFVEERLTGGLFAKYFRYTVSGDFSSHLYDMNRGACYLALMFWVVVACLRAGNRGQISTSPESSFPPPPLAGHTRVEGVGGGVLSKMSDVRCQMSERSSLLIIDSCQLLAEETPPPTPPASVGGESEDSASVGGESEDSASGGVREFLSCNKGKIFILWLVVLGVLLSLSSLSAIVAHIAGGVAYIIRSKKVVILCVTAVMLLTPFVMREINPEKIVASYTLPKSAEHRLYIWKFSANKAFEKWESGWGFNSSRSIPDGNKEIKNGWVNLPIHPHNLVIQTFLELGIVGLILLVSFISILLYTTKGMEALIVTYLSIGMTGFGAWQHWWISAGFLIACFISILRTND